MLRHSTMQQPAISPIKAAGQKPTFLEVLSTRSFHYLWLGNGLSDMGDKTLSMVIAWLVLEMTDSKLWVGIINGIPAISMVLFAIMGSVMADRSDRRVMVMKARLTLASLTFLAGALVTSGVIELWHMVAIALLAGAVNAIDLPTARTLVFDVVGRKNLLSANSMNSMARSLGYITGPTAVGAIIGNWTIDAALYLLSTVYLIAFLVMLKVRTSHRPPNTQKAHVLVDLMEGIAYIRRTPPVAWLIALTFTLPFSGVFFGMLPVYARDVLQVVPQGLGTLMAAFGAGALVSSASLALRGRLQHQALIMTLSGVGFAGGMLALAFSRSFPLTLVSVFFTGVLGLYWVNTASTMMQATAAEEMRGRIMGIFMIGTQLMSLGWLIGGVLATLFGNAGSLVISAVITSSFGVFVYIRSKEVRELS
jgi:MFS family permease